METQDIEPQLKLAAEHEQNIAEARSKVQNLEALEKFDGDPVRTMRYRVGMPEMYSDGAIIVTPLELSDTGAWHKQETKQATGAFKPRGAFANAWLTLEANPGVRNLAACSAGNHAQGLMHFVGWHNYNYGQELRAHPFMAQSASQTKVDALIKMGATIHNIGYRNLEEARTGAEQFVRASEEDTAMIDPYAAPETIAGQGTVLTETIMQLWAAGVDTTEKPLNMYVGWGGGGLALGQATTLKALIALGYVHPGSRIIAVQEELTDSGIRGLERYEAGSTDMSGLFAPGEFSDTNDGTAVQVPNLYNVALAHKLRQEGYLSFMRVSKAQVGRAMILNPGTEPAGALSAAGYDQRYPYRGPADAIAVCVLSGSNMTPDKFEEYRNAYFDSIERTPRMLGGYVLRGGPAAGPEQQTTQMDAGVAKEYRQQLADGGIELLPSSLQQPPKHRIR